jgi:phage terminase large subunit-like protein
LSEEVVCCELLSTLNDLRPIVARPYTGKLERFNGCLGEVEAGHFLLPKEAPWLDDFRNELRAFLHDKYDDQVDSFSQFVKLQLAAWRWVLTEYDDWDGRSLGVVRHDVRPW